MKRFAVAILIAFIFFHTASGGDGAEQPQAKPLAQFYADSLRAETEVLEARFEMEQHRLTTLQELLNGGHASWFEVRKQRLKVNELSARLSVYKDFLSKVETWTNRLIPPNQFAELKKGRVPFSDLCLTSRSANDYWSRVDLAEKTESNRNDLANRVASRDKLKNETDSLPDSDSWKKGFELRLQIANSEVKAFKSRLRVLEYFTNNSKEETSAELVSMNWSGIPAQSVNAKVIKTSLNLCIAYDRLIDHCLQLENHRLAKLKELAQAEMGEQRDLETVSGRITELKKMSEMQLAISEFLGSLKDQNSLVSSGAGDENATAVRTIDESSRPITWERIQNCFLRSEASVQLKSANLEKEMLKEVLSRLEQAAQNYEETTTHNSTISKTLETAKQTELQSYRWKIEFAELRIKLANARLSCLAEQRASGIFVLNIDSLLKSTPILHNAETSPDLLDSTLAQTAAFAGKAAAGDLSTKQTSIELVEILPYINPGLSTICPVQLLDSGFNYQPVKLVDYSRAVRLRFHRPLSSTLRPSPTYLNDLKQLTSQSSQVHNDSDNSLSRRLIPTLDRAYQSGVLRNPSLSWQRDYGSLSPLTRRLLPTLDRTHQDDFPRATIYPVYSVGQPPWQIPGSPNDRIYNQLREYKRNSDRRKDLDFIRSEFYRELFAR